VRAASWRMAKAWRRLQARFGDSAQALRGECNENKVVYRSTASGRFVSVSQQPGVILSWNLHRRPGDCEANGGQRTLSRCTRQCGDRAGRGGVLAAGHTFNFSKESSKMLALALDLFQQLPLNFNVKASEYGGSFAPHGALFDSTDCQSVHGQDAPVQHNYCTLLRQRKISRASQSIGQRSDHGMNALRKAQGTVGGANRKSLLLHFALVNVANGSM
jgi:hypothetical protein